MSYLPSSPYLTLNWFNEFLKDRQQRVKLNGTFSELLKVPAEVLQGTRLDPWLFLVLINDLQFLEGFLMWKFADDTIVSEVVFPSKQSCFQQVVDHIYTCSKDNLLQLNPIKL